MKERTNDETINVVLMYINVGLMVIDPHFHDQFANGSVAGHLSFILMLLLLQHVVT